MKKRLGNLKYKDLVNAITIVSAIYGRLNTVLVVLPGVGAGVMGCGCGAGAGASSVSALWCCTPAATLCAASDLRGSSHVVVFVM